MKIIVLDTLIDQTKDISLPGDTAKSIVREFHRLSELESDENSLQAYLLKQNGKPMQGAQYIYKYRLNDGDRILYTYSKFLPWLKEEIEDSLVLLRYSKHENQGKDAKSFNRGKKHGYWGIDQVAGSMPEMGFDEEDIRDGDLAAWSELFTERYPNHHLIYVVSDDKEYASLSSDEMEVKLSSEQKDCISTFSSNPSPTLIIGGAGSGKTLIAVHILINAARSFLGNRLCYFTQSQALRNKVRSLFKQYGDGVQETGVDFNDINDYCIDRLNLKRKNLVRTDEFIKFLNSNPIAKEIKEKTGLSAIEVWTDVRGVIKGGLSSEWTRTAAIPQERFQEEYSSKVLKSLIEKKYIKRTKKDQKKIELTDGISESIRREKSDDSLSAEERKALRMVLDYFSGVDSAIPMLSEADYESVPEERTTVEKSKRSDVWKICDQYQIYLDQNGLYDENDLARWMLERLREDDKYDLSVVDEVQDYTELQIYLIKRLTSSSKVVFAGDEHQNVNPASFSESRLKSLFYSDSRNGLRVVRLRKNFRCRSCIIELTNTLAELRKEVIATGSAENEEPEIAIVPFDAHPNRLKYSAENLNSIISSLIKYPKAVILVPNDEIKKKVNNRIKALKKPIIAEIGEERYSARESTTVFTVAEIKGMEYEYVLCIDLISIYREIWGQILSAGRKQTKYRYYFNLLYVAMTRAQKYLCFIDQKLADGLEQRLEFCVIDAFSSEDLFLDNLKSDTGDWYEQAVKLEKDGKYREALQYYKQAKAEPECAFRCNYWLAVEERDFNTAAKFSLLLDSPEDYPAYLDDIDDHETKKLLETYLFLKGNRSDYSFIKPNISSLIESNYGEFEENEITRAQKVFLNVLARATKESLNRLG